MEYATASTDEAIFIIGGLSSGFAGDARLTTIAAFEEDENGVCKWRIAGSLRYGRMSHAAISLGSTIMVVGGFGRNGAYV